MVVSWPAPSYQLRDEGLLVADVAELLVAGAQLARALLRRHGLQGRERIGVRADDDLAQFCSLCQWRRSRRRLRTSEGTFDAAEMSIDRAGIEEGLKTGEISKRLVGRPSDMVGKAVRRAKRESTRSKFPVGARRATPREILGPTPRRAAARRDRDSEPEVEARYTVRALTTPGQTFRNSTEHRFRASPAPRPRCASTRAPQRPCVASQHNDAQRLPAEARQAPPELEAPLLRAQGPHPQLLRRRAARPRRALRHQPEQARRLRPGRGRRRRRRLQPLGAAGRHQAARRVGRGPRRLGLRHRRGAPAAAAADGHAGQIS